MLKIYANALLSNGEILFWRTARRIYNEYDFYKDFMRSGIDQMEYFKTHDIEVSTMCFEFDNENYDNMNNYVFEVLAKHFYRQFKLSSDSKGESPHLIKC